MGEREQRSRQLERDARYALEKAETALEKRLELLNEFRQQTADLQAHYVTRDAFEQFRETWRVEHEILAKQINEAQGRHQAHIRLNTTIATFAVGLGAIGTLLAVVIK
jgi:multidrug resistance efflux pump